MAKLANFCVVEALRAVGMADGLGASALEELEADGAGDDLVGLIDEGLECFAEGVEPLAVIDELAVADGGLLHVVVGVAFEAELLEGLVGFVEDGAAWGFVHAAGLHADQAVFDEGDHGRRRACRRSC